MGFYVLENNPLQYGSELRERAMQALIQIQNYFLNSQDKDGYWIGELESNPTMEAEYLLLTNYLDVQEQERTSLIIKDIENRQSEDGSWGMYYKAPGDLSTSVECYFALKLMGVSPEKANMRLAKEFILSKGGIREVRVFTKIWLALFGQWGWDKTPVMPPEIILLPKWLPFNPYRFSSWARATILPLCIVLTQRPIKSIPSRLSVEELHRDFSFNRNANLNDQSSGKSIIEMVFRLFDRCLHLYEHSPLKPFRSMALRKLEKWIIAHQEADGSWGGIQPPWVYSLIALNCLGYSKSHPVILKGLTGFKGNWSILSKDKQSMRVQACLSPLWDTALVLLGLVDSSVSPNHPALQKSAKWLIQREVKVKGDWAIKAPKIKPSGWPFEFDNNMYPDIDDSSLIVIGLHNTRFNNPEEESQRTEAIGNAVNWLLGMQSSNGGWASFDKDNTDRLMAKIPFSDFGEMIDPPSVDVTAHVLEMLARLGYTKDHPAAKSALIYIKKEQESDGPWFGRWGVNYIYGTGAVLPALKAIGEDMSQPYIQQAIQWIINHQNNDGGWGETCASYANASLRGIGESTPSQTSWALISLLSALEISDETISKGISYLVTSQRKDGTWQEPHFTGCGFPGYGIGDLPKAMKNSAILNNQGEELAKGFMIKYHLYRNYFPLIALGRYKNACDSTSKH